MDDHLRSRLSRVRLFLCDVDGVLTDASVFIGAGNVEMKRFNIRDGLAFRLLQRFGFKTGWVSNRLSVATTQRGKELDIDYVEQAERDRGPGMKIAAVEGILAHSGFSWEETLFMGDDVIDLGVMRRVGAAVAVADAVPEAIEVADYTTRAAGGHGAVREAVELVLEAHGHWQGIVEGYSA